VIGLAGVEAGPEAGPERLEVEEMAQIRGQSRKGFTYLYILTTIALSFKSSPFTHSLERPHPQRNHGRPSNPILPLNRVPGLFVPTPRARGGGRGDSQSVKCNEGNSTVPARRIIGAPGLCGVFSSRIVPCCTQRYTDDPTPQMALTTRQHFPLLALITCIPLLRPHPQA